MARSVGTPQIDELIQGQLGEARYQLRHPIADPANGVGRLQLRWHRLALRVDSRHHLVVREPRDP